VIVPLVEVNTQRALDATVMDGATALEWMTTLVLVLAVLQDVHVLFDWVAGVTSSIMDVPVGYQRCELCGEVLLVTTHRYFLGGHSRRYDALEQPVDLDEAEQQSLMISGTNCGISHNCDALRRAAFSSSNSLAALSHQEGGMTERRLSRYLSSSYGAVHDSTDDGHELYFSDSLSSHYHPPSLFVSADGASALSRWTFSWLSPFVNFSYRNGPEKVFADERIAALIIPALPAAMRSLARAVMPAIHVWRNLRVIDPPAEVPHEHVAAVTDGIVAPPHPRRTRGECSLMRRVGAWLFLRLFVDKESADEMRQEHYRTLFSLFLETDGGWRFSRLCVVLKLGQDLLSATSPVMVSYLIHFIKALSVNEHAVTPFQPPHVIDGNNNNGTLSMSGTHADSTATQVTTTMAHGVFLCGMMFVLLALQTLLFQNYLRH
jgi:hypothetical protein